MSFFDKLFDDFNKDNCLEWLTDIARFFRNPRRFVDRIANLPSGDILPRYAFYFILYTTAFLLLFIGSDLSAVIRPAILSLISSVFLILAFSGITYLVTRHNYFNKLFIYIISIILFASPVIILLYTQFLNVENYAYKLASSTIWAAAHLAAFLLFPFVIESRSRKAWWIFTANFLVTNLIWLALSFVQFDHYKGDSTLNADPIVTEYMATYEQLTFRDSIPMRRVFFRDGKDKLICVFLIQDPVDSTHRILGSIEQNKYYVKAIASNINLLNKSITDAKFRRNQVMFGAWKDYYTKILIECSYAAPDDRELVAGLQAKTYFTEKINGVDRLMMAINYLPIVGAQIFLKRDHNNLSHAFTRAEIPLLISDRVTYFLGYILEGFYLEYFQPMDKKPYKEQFEKIESML